MRFIPPATFEVTLFQKSLKRDELKPLKITPKGDKQVFFYNFLLQNLKSPKENKKVPPTFIGTFSQNKIPTPKVQDFIKKKVNPWKGYPVKGGNIIPLKRDIDLKDYQKIANISDVSGLKVGELILFLWKGIKTSDGILRKKNINDIISNFRGRYSKRIPLQIPKFGKADTTTLITKNLFPIAGKPKTASYLKSYEKHLPNQRLEYLVISQSKKYKENKNSDNTQEFNFLYFADRFYEHEKRLKKVFPINKITKIDTENLNNKVISIKIPLEEKTILQIRMVKDSFYAKILTTNDKVNLLIQNLNQLTQQIVNLGFSKTVVNVQSFTGSNGSFKQDSQRGNRYDNKHNNNGEKLEKVTENGNRISFSYYL
ncbi:MAG TPA: hypothetical protein EYH48_02340 [Aquifex aeolicus]|uniref:Uncharacterized protein n=1 Tax=Aquifex aeolicus TaxID=63363 RepID=A0A9D1CEJ4_AQUAO|nr:hypothetical protein [Aquificales bacterium]HIP97930.1 hypothetical protein [Aquifex aeolicus]HIQ26159.1 hypothetical protein [Aquifex aeolicus]